MHFTCALETRTVEFALRSARDLLGNKPQIAEQSSRMAKTSIQLQVLQELQINPILVLGCDPHLSFGNIPQISGCDHHLVATAKARLEGGQLKAHNLRNMQSPIMRSM